MNKSILELFARVVGWFEPSWEGGRGPGHPLAETVRALATLRGVVARTRPVASWTGAA